MASLFDSDQDGLLSPDDLQKLFAPLPDGLSPWKTTRDETPISKTEFLCLWNVLLRHDPAGTCYSLLLLGYWGQANYMVHWKQLGQRDRRVGYCAGEGKLYESLVSKLETIRILSPVSLSVAITSPKMFSHRTTLIPMCPVVFYL